MIFEPTNGPKATATAVGRSLGRCDAGGVLTTCRRRRRNKEEEEEKKRRRELGAKFIHQNGRKGEDGGDCVKWEQEKKANGVGYGRSDAGEQRTGE